MALALAEPIPLQRDGEGVLRVGGTRVTLETLVHNFENGATPEEIAQDFPVLRLDDVYAVITYYLRNREECENYLAEQHQVGENNRRIVESRFPTVGLRERLLARVGR